MKTVYELIQEAKIGRTRDFTKLKNIKNLDQDLGSEYNDTFGCMAFYESDKPIVGCELCGILYKERPSICLCKSNVFLKNL